MFITKQFTVNYLERHISQGEKAEKKYPITA